MDEFDIFRARAYGGYVEPSGTEEEENTVNVVGGGLNGNVENEEWVRRESVGRRRRSVRKSAAESGESGRWVADRSQSPGGVSSSTGGGERRGSSRSRINSQVTVAVEPPSPTERSREAHQRSQSWKARQVRLSPDCYDQAEQQGEEVSSSPSSRNKSTSPSTGLHRTRTMPARRSASPRRRSPAVGVPSHPVIVEPGTDSGPPSPEGSTEALGGGGGECRIYRVRSFTTKKGGIVNRGDSIKVCSGSSRRVSRCADNLLAVATPSGGSSRRNSTASTGRGSLQPFQPTPLQLRRNSESCIDAPNVDIPGVAVVGGGDSGVVVVTSSRKDSVNRRASCRNIAFEDQDEAGSSGGVALGRRASSVRLLQSPGAGGGETGRSGSNSALWSVDGKRPVNGGASSCHRDVELLMKVNGGRSVEACGADEEEGDEDEDGEDGTGGEEAVYNVVVVGGHGVGKTTLIHQLLTSEYLANKENYQADHDDGEKTVSVQLDDVESMVHFEDAAFSDDFPSMRDGGDEGVDAYLIVYSVTDRSSFAYCQSCLQEFQKRRKRTVAMLVANKQDLVRNRLISEGEGKRLASKRRCEFLEVSALLDHRVDEVLVTIIRLIRQHNGKTGLNGGGGGGEAGMRRGGKGRPTSSSDDDLHSNRGCIHKAAAAIFRKLFK